MKDVRTLVRCLRVRSSIANITQSQIFVNKFFKLFKKVLKNIDKKSICMYSGHIDKDRESVTWHDAQSAQSEKGDLLNLPVKRKSTSISLRRNRK